MDTNSMIRILVCFLVSLMLSACKDQQKTAVESFAIQDKPEKWLVFEGAAASSKHIVLISGDEEYRSEEALPQLAKILSKRHGFKCTVLFSQDTLQPGIVNANHSFNIYGLHTLGQADLMVIFTRFRALPDEQMQHIDSYVKKGKPVVGIRTATHAFNFGDSTPTSFSHYSYDYDGEKTAWKDGFGRLVLGETWINHHGSHKHQSTRGIVAENARAHPITNGIEDGDVWGSTDVYGLRLPLPGNATPLLFGQVMDRDGDYDENDLFYGMKPTDNVAATVNAKGLALNDPMMPVAWVKSYQVPGGVEGQAFTSTIGSSSDLLTEGTRRLLVNGIFWALDLEVPQRADVRLVGTYQPTQYEFHEDTYWTDTLLKITDLK